MQNSLIGSSTKTVFFANVRHEWGKPNLLMQNFSIGSSTKNGFFAIEDMNGPNPTS
jgi:hypothetical protein